MSEMKLPEGKTCSMCFAFEWCKDLFQCSPDNTECDYFPVRFKGKESEKTSEIKRYNINWHDQDYDESPTGMIVMHTDHAAALRQASGDNIELLNKIKQLELHNEKLDALVKKYSLESAINFAALRQAHDERDKAKRELDEWVSDPRRKHLEALRHVKIDMAKRIIVMINNNFRHGTYHSKPDMTDIACDTIVQKIRAEAEKENI